MIVADAPGAIEPMMRAYFDAWERADADAIAAMLAPAYVDHDPPPGVAPDRDAQIGAVRDLARCTVDRSVRIAKLVVANDVVAVRSDTTWTQTAPLFRIAAGARVVVRGCEIYRFERGLIVESWRAESVTTRAAP